MLKGLGMYHIFVAVVENELAVCPSSTGEISMARPVGTNLKCFKGIVRIKTFLLL